MDKLVAEINRLELSMVRKVGGKIELAQPIFLSETIAKIAIYLSQLSDEVSNAELTFKQSRAARFDALLKSGEKITSAERLIRFDQELIKKENDGERLKNFIKRTENVISTIQTHIRVKGNEANTNL